MHDLKCLPSVNNAVFENFLVIFMIILKFKHLVFQKYLTFGSTKTKRKVMPKIWTSNELSEMKSGSIKGHRKVTIQFDIIIDYIIPTQIYKQLWEIWSCKLYTYFCAISK